jgi:hypothetical protein
VTVVADSGYWHQQQMERIISRGIEVLIPPDAGKRKGTRPGWDGGIYAFMRNVLDSDHGGAIYAQRKAMIEPVFGNTKFNRGIDRFQRRGRAACRSEWRLITATHNLLKALAARQPPAGGLTRAPPSPPAPSPTTTFPRKRPTAGFTRQPPSKAEGIL